MEIGCASDGFDPMNMIALLWLRSLNELVIAP